MTTEDTAPLGPVTVLVYSSDAAVRTSVRTALGRRPAADLGRLEYVETDTERAVLAALDAARRGGGPAIDLCVLDGEARPTGGLGMGRQLKSEYPNCPPVLALVARRDDAWLASWSLADGVAQHPVDAIRLVEVVVDLLRQRKAGVPAAGTVAAARRR